MSLLQPGLFSHNTGLTHVLGNALQKQSRGGELIRNKGFLKKVPHFSFFKKKVISVFQRIGI